MCIRDRSQCDGQEWPSYDQSFQPVWSCVLARQKHVNQDANPEVEVTFAYTDGFFQEGQTVRLNQVLVDSTSPPQPAQTPTSKPKTKNQRRAQGKRKAFDREMDRLESDLSNPQLTWLASGVRQLNNKGKPVREYEPFFTDSHHYQYHKQGVSKTLFYDPLERVVGTLHPDHSWEKTTFNAWGEVRWDRNDTVLLDPHDDPDLGGYFSRLFDDEFIPTWMDLQRTAELQPTKFVGQQHPVRSTGFSRLGMMAEQQAIEQAAVSQAPNTNGASRKPAASASPLSHQRHR